MITLSACRQMSPECSNHPQLHFTILPSVNLSTLCVVLSTETSNREPALRTSNEELFSSSLATNEADMKSSCVNILYTAASVSMGIPCFNTLQRFGCQKKKQLINMIILHVMLSCEHYFCGLFGCITKDVECSSRASSALLDFKRLLY